MVADDSLLAFDPVLNAAAQLRPEYNIQLGLLIYPQRCAVRINRAQPLGAGIWLPQSLHTTSKRPI